MQGVVFENLSVNKVEQNMKGIFFDGSRFFFSFLHSCQSFSIICIWLFFLALKYGENDEKYVNDLEMSLNFLNVP